MNRCIDDLNGHVLLLKYLNTYLSQPHRLPFFFPSSS